MCIVIIYSSVVDLLFRTLLFYYSFSCYLLFFFIGAFFWFILNTDGNRIAAHVSGRERTVAAAGHAQLQGWVRPVVQASPVQRNRELGAVGRKHHRIRIISI